LINELLDQHPPWHLRRRRKTIPVRVRIPRVGEFRNGARLDLATLQSATEDEAGMDILDVSYHNGVIKC
jgi:hypothetical protein